MTEYFREFITPISPPVVRLRCSLTATRSAPLGQPGGYVGPPTSDDIRGHLDAQNEEYRKEVLTPYWTPVGERKARAELESQLSAALTNSSPLTVQTVTRWYMNAPSAEVAKVREMVDAAFLPTMGNQLRDELSAAVAEKIEAERKLASFNDEEAARWQDRIADTIISFGLEPADCSGNESGDALDWTDGQVRAAIGEHARDEVLRFARLILHGDDGHRVWLLDAAGRFGDGEDELPAASTGEDDLAPARETIASVSAILTDEAVQHDTHKGGPLSLVDKAKRALEGWRDRSDAEDRAQTELRAARETIRRLEATATIAAKDLGDANMSYREQTDANAELIAECGRHIETIRKLEERGDRDAWNELTAQQNVSASLQTELAELEKEHELTKQRLGVQENKIDIQHHQLRRQNESREKREGRILGLETERGKLQEAIRALTEEHRVTWIRAQAASAKKLNTIAVAHPGVCMTPYESPRSEEGRPSDGHFPGCAVVGCEATRCAERAAFWTPAATTGSRLAAGKTVDVPVEAAGPTCLAPLTDRERAIVTTAERLIKLSTGETLYRADAVGTYRDLKAAVDLPKTHDVRREDYSDEKEFPDLVYRQNTSLREKLRLATEQAEALKGVCGGARIFIDRQRGEIEPERFRKLFAGHSLALVDALDVYEALRKERGWT